MSNNSKTSKVYVTFTACYWGYSDVPIYSFFSFVDSFLFHGLFPGTFCWSTFFHGLLVRAFCSSLFPWSIFIVSLQGHKNVPCFDSQIVSSAVYEHVSEIVFYMAFFCSPEVPVYQNTTKKPPNLFLKWAPVGVTALFISRHCRHWYCWCCSGIV